MRYLAEMPLTSVRGLVSDDNFAFNVCNNAVDGNVRTTGEAIPSLFDYKRAGSTGTAPPATKDLTKAQRNVLHDRATQILKIIGYHVSDVVDRMLGLIAIPTSAIKQRDLDEFVDAVLDDLQIPEAEKAAFRKREAGLIYRSGKEVFLNAAEAEVVVRAATRGNVPNLAAATIKTAVNTRINDAALFAPFACTA